MPYDSDNENTSDESDNDQMPTKYANDYETVLDKVKYDENMKNDDPKDVATKDVVLYKRDNGIPTKDKRPIETRDIADDFMREYDEMHKSMEYKQIYDYYEAQRHICHATARQPPFPVNYMSWFPSKLRGKAVPSTESPYSGQVSERDNRTLPSCHMAKSQPIRSFPTIKPRMASAKQRLSHH